VLILEDRLEVPFVQIAETVSRCRLAAVTALRTVVLSRSVNDLPLASPSPAPRLPLASPSPVPRHTIASLVTSARLWPAGRPTENEEHLKKAKITIASAKNNPIAFGRHYPASG